MRNTIDRHRLLSSARLQRASRTFLAGLASILLLVLTACGPSKADATPTLSVDAVYTAAFQTFSAQQATELASTPPTETPSPTLFPTLAPPSTLLPFGTATSGAGGAVGCDSSLWVSDVTVPDGTVMAPGQSFVKTWVVLNNGTCPWTTSYRLVFAGGDAMGGSAVAIASPVAAGQQVQLSVHLTAPSSGGSAKSTWQMQNDKSQYFGNGLFALITVSGAVTGTAATAVPTSASGMVTISGKTGAANTTISYTGGTAFVTDAGGNYSFTVSSGWSGTVTPSKGKYVFSPLSRTYSNVTSDMSGQNYTASSVTATP